MTLGASHLIPEQGLDLCFSLVIGGGERCLPTTRLQHLGIEVVSFVVVALDHFAFAKAFEEKGQVEPLFFWSREIGMLVVRRKFFASCALVDGQLVVVLCLGIGRKRVGAITREFSVMGNVLGGSCTFEQMLGNS